MPLPLFSMSISGQPIAIIKSGDRQLQFYKVKKFLSKYFSTSDGVYELDDQYILLPCGYQHLKPVHNRRHFQLFKMPCLMTLLLCSLRMIPV